MPPASGLDSFVELGNRYEESVRRMLGFVGMELIKIGGRGDQGIDLHGVWSLDASFNPKVIVQCKNISKPASPVLMRELEGTMMRSFTIAQASPVQKTIGIFASPMAPSDACMNQLRRSPFPLLYIKTKMENADIWMEGVFSSFVFQKDFPQISTVVSRSLDWIENKRVLFYYNNELIKQLT
jgi:hypothetical protein